MITNDNKRFQAPINFPIVGREHPNRQAPWGEENGLVLLQSVRRIAAAASMQASLLRWASKMQRAGRQLQRVEPWCDVPSCDGNSTQKRRWATPQRLPLRRRWTPESDPRSCNGKGYAHSRTQSTAAVQRDSRVGLLLLPLLLPLY
jgi:hypothetical protein